MTETIIPKMNLRVIIDKDTIKVKDANEVVLYFHKGKFIFKWLDDENFAIIEKEKSEPSTKMNGYTLLFFHCYQEKKYIQIEKFLIKKDYGNLFNKDLLPFKELIIPGLYKDFIYSFEHNLEMSDSFTRIIFDKEEENFICREDIVVKNGIVSLFGTLDIDGFLLNEAMYAPMFRKEFYVDPLNVSKKIAEIKEKLQIMMYKKIDDEKQRAINEYECDCYLARKKG